MDEWTSLEAAKLAVASLTPLAVLALGLLVSRSTRRMESLQHANETVVAQRLEVFGQVSPKLNQLLCFVAFVGRWKELTPADALTIKRDVDDVMHINRWLFSDPLFATYEALMGRLFAMYASVDGDAPIRARISSELGDRRLLRWWRPDMAEMFAKSQICEPEDARLVYDELSAAFRADLYVIDLTHPLPNAGTRRAISTRGRTSPSGALPVADRPRSDRVMSFPRSAS